MRSAATAVLLGAAVLLAACGGSSSNGEASKAPAQIVKDAQSAATAAGAVHVSGTVTTGGTSVGVDLHLVGDNHAKGHLTVSGFGIDVVRVGDTVYIRGSKAFYTKFAGATAAALLNGKWLSGAATTGSFASFEQLTDMKTFFSGMLGSHGTLAKGKEATVAGQKAIAIDDTTKGGTLYVATTGKPYPVELTKTGSTSDKGTVTFTDWDKTTTVTAPKGAVDLSALGG